MNRRDTFTAAGCVLVACPKSANAHLADVGLGPVYDGLAHPFLTPTQLLPVIALSIMAALTGGEHGRTLFVLLPGTWLIGGLCGLSFAHEPDEALLVAGLTFGLGTLCAGDMKLSVRVFGLLAAVVGVCLGLLDGMAAQAAGRGTLSVLGIAATVAAVATAVTGHGVALGAGTLRIGLRVGGSWIAAIGLLSAGWSLRPMHVN